MNDKEEIAPALESLYSVNLGVKRSERVLVFTDYPNITPELAESSLKRSEDIQQVASEVAAFGRNRCEIIFCRYPATSRHGVEPPPILWEKAFGSRLVDLLEDQELLAKILAKDLNLDELSLIRKLVAANRDSSVDVVIALAYHSTSHTLFRKLLTEICGTRYASMPEFERPMLRGAMAVDYLEMAGRTAKIAVLISQAASLRITAPNGTDLTIVIGGRQVLSDTGLLTEPGSFSNLPAGEVFLAPLEDQSSGKLVFDLAAGEKLVQELCLEFSEGKVSQIRGQGPYRDYLEKLFADSHLNRNLAELGIGTNTGAKNPYNVLEAEKIWGTIHIALGDNSSFGGTVATSFHQDYVVSQPSITLFPADADPLTVLVDGQWKL